MVDLHIHGSQSLKQKRGIVRSITRRVSNNFNVSIAELEGQQTWQRVGLGVSVVGQNGQTVRRKLEKLIDFIADLHLAEIVGQEIEVIQTPFGEYEQVELHRHEDRFE